MWYPNVENQVITMSNLVQTGPYIPKYAFQDESTWELKYKYIFISSGEAHTQQMKQCKIQKHKESTPFPILSLKQYKLATRSNKPTRQCLETGTTEGALLQQQLLKECQNTSKLIHLSHLMNQKLQKRKRKSQQKSHTSKKKHKKCRAVSTHSSKKIPAKTQKTSSSSSFTSSSSSKSSSTTSSNS